MLRKGSCVGCIALNFVANSRIRTWFLFVYKAYFTQTSFQLRFMYTGNHYSQLQALAQIQYSKTKHIETLLSLELYNQVVYTVFYTLAINPTCLFYIIFNFTTKQNINNLAYCNITWPSMVLLLLTIPMLITQYGVVDDELTTYINMHVVTWKHFFTISQKGAILEAGHLYRL